IEYIIIDGLSTDNTVKIAESYKEKFSKKNYSYKIISEKDQGIYEAMNKGIKITTGEIVGMINSDDWYELDAVEKVAEKYVETNFDLMYADIRLIKQGNVKV